MNEVQGPTALGHWRTVWHAAMWQAVRVLADPGRAGARVAQSKRRREGSVLCCARWLCSTLIGMSGCRDQGPNPQARHVSE